MNLNKLNFKEIEEIKRMLLNGNYTDFNLNLYHIINMVEQDTTATFKELLNSKLKQVTKNK